MKIESAIQNTYKELSSMKKINSAADNAANLSIGETLKSIEKGFEATNNNALSMEDLSKTADGALSSVNDNLQRIRELSISSQNAMLSDDDKSLIQNEIDQLKSSISDTVENTTYNNTKLLDGSFSDKNLSLNSNGDGTSVSIADSSLAALGIEDFDVTGNFDIGDIDKAISNVSESRGNIGAVQNRISHTVNVNKETQQNTLEAVSRLLDTDVAESISKLKTQQIMQQYKNFADQQKSETKANNLNLFG